MLKIPFIEHTIVSIEISSEEIRWLEIGTIGKRSALISSGEIFLKEKEGSLDEEIKSIKEQLVSDAYFVGISVPEALVEIFVEDVPYSEEPEEIDRWITEKEKEILKSFELKTVLVQHHIIDIDEESKKCMFQILDVGVISHYKEFFVENEISPKYITSGVLEYGYSQIYNPSFLEGNSSMLQFVNQKAFLTVFEQGLIKNVYELVAKKGEDLSFLLQEADSYLQTEESSNDEPIHSIPIFASLREKEIRDNDGIMSRLLIGLNSFSGKKGFEKLSGNFAMTSGVSSKITFPGLDSFNYSNQDEIEKATISHDKKEALRLGILLFVPLIFFAFVTYAFDRTVDYRLVESNQIMDRIGDKIDEVSTKRDVLIKTKDQFVDARAILVEKTPQAYIFELIGNDIPSEVWLVGMKTNNSPSKARIEASISGFSNSDGAISTFLNKLENRAEVLSAELVVSEKIEERNSRSQQSRPELMGATRFEIRMFFSR